MPTQPYMLTGADGREFRVPGVTTVLGNIGWSKDGLMYWANKMGRAGYDLNQARGLGAADIGTIAHALVEAHIDISGKGAAEHDRILAEAPEAFRAPAMSAFEAYRRWEGQTRGQIIATEVWLVNAEYETGGCIDALRIEEDGTLAVLDWKSANGTYEDHLLQIAAYTEFIERALTEWGGGTPMRCSGAYLCRFGKEAGNYVAHYWPREALRVAWTAFTYARALHKFRPTIRNLVK
jgi:hypothetical protein